MGTESSDWAALKKLADATERVELGEHAQLIRRVAEQVGVSSDGELKDVLVRSRNAIKDGSKRLMVAITAAQSAYAAGNYVESERLLKSALSEEPIAYYREILSMELARRTAPR